MTSKVYSCNRCKDTQTFEQGSSYITPCPYCNGRKKFMAHLANAIKQAKIRHKTELEKDLIAVNSMLPEYPVMATLEAEARGLRSEFIEFIREAFDTFPLIEPIDRFVKESGV